VLRDDGALLACAANAVVLALVDAGVPLARVAAAVAVALPAAAEAAPALLLDPTAAEEAAARAVLTFAVADAAAGDAAPAVLATAAAGQFSPEEWLLATEAARSAAQAVFLFYRKALERRCGLAPAPLAATRAPPHPTRRAQTLQGGPGRQTAQGAQEKHVAAPRRRPPPYVMPFRNLINK
jgi:hypothetical protein